MSSRIDATDVRLHRIRGEPDAVNARCIRFAGRSPTGAGRRRLQDRIRPPQLPERARVLPRCSARLIGGHANRTAPDTRHVRGWW